MTDLTDNELDIIRQALPPGTARGIVEHHIHHRANETNLDRREWDRWCGHFGLTSADFGRIFTIKRSLYKVTGINVQAPRYPINCERQPDGKVFRVPAAAVR